MRFNLSTLQIWRVLSVVLWTMLVATLVTACGTAGQPAQTQLATYEPTYMVYNRAVFATAIAIGDTIPTPSPRPNLRPDLQENEKHRYIWNIAISTAVTLFPPPPGYNPGAETTPEITRVMPTEPPHPYRATDNGRIYDTSVEDNPMGKVLRIVNYWIGRIGKVDITVYAGHDNQDTNAGVLLMRRFIEGDQTREPDITVDSFPASTESGALRIMGETGGQLTLQSASGAYIYFNLTTRQWVSSSGTPLPLPSPSSSPILSPLSSPSPLALPKPHCPNNPQLPSSNEPPQEKGGSSILINN